MPRWIGQDILLFVINHFILSSTLPSFVRGNNACSLFSFFLFLLLRQKTNYEGSSAVACMKTMYMGDVVLLRVKPQKPLCCKVRRPAVVRQNPCDGVSSRHLSQLLPTQQFESMQMRVDKQVPPWWEGKTAFPSHTGHVTTEDCLWTNAGSMA